MRSMNEIWYSSIANWLVVNRNDKVQLENRYPTMIAFHHRRVSSLNWYQCRNEKTFQLCRTIKHERDMQMRVQLKTVCHSNFKIEYEKSTHSTNIRIIQPWTTKMCPFFECFSTTTTSEWFAVWWISVNWGKSITCYKSPYETDLLDFFLFPFGSVGGKCWLMMHYECTSDR